MKQSTYRGKVYLAPVDVADVQDASPTTKIVANLLQFLGNCSKLTITPNSNFVPVKDWTGVTDDANTGGFTRVSGGTVEILLEEATLDNLALALGARTVVSEAQSVTGALFAGYDPTGKRWYEKNDNTAWRPSVANRLVKELYLAGQQITYWDLIDPDTFVLYDSSATPKELELGTDYTFDAVYGKVWLKNTASHGVNLPGLTYPLLADFDAGLQIDTLPTIVSNNATYQLSGENLKEIVLKDSSSSPKTIPDTYYTVDSDYGQITLTNVTAIKAISGITFPLKAYSTIGQSTSIGMFTNLELERKLILNGVDTRNGNAKVKVEQYRLSIDPGAIDWFDTDYTKVPLKFEFLADPSKSPDDPNGPFGKVTRL